MSNFNRPTVGLHTNPERINRKGRPKKGFSMTGAFREVLAIKDPKKKIERYKIIIEKAIVKAERGDNDMIKYIINRLDGLPKGSAPIIPIDARQQKIEIVIKDDDTKQIKGSE